MPSLVSTRSMRPRTFRPGSSSTGVAGLAVAERQLEVLGLEAAVALGLAAQEAQQVELEPPGGGLARGSASATAGTRSAGCAAPRAAAARRARGWPGVTRRVAGLLAQALERALQHRVRVAAAHHLLRVGHQLVGPQDVLHEPLDRAVGEVLERAWPRPPSRAARRSSSGVGASSGPAGGSAPRARPPPARARARRRWGRPRRSR